MVWVVGKQNELLIPLLSHNQAMDIKPAVNGKTGLTENPEFVHNNTLYGAYRYYKSFWQDKQAEIEAGTYSLNKLETEMGKKLKAVPMWYEGIPRKAADGTTDYSACTKGIYVVRTGLTKELYAKWFNNTESPCCYDFFNAVVTYAGPVMARIDELNLDLKKRLSDMATLTIDLTEARARAENGLKVATEASAQLNKTQALLESESKEKIRLADLLKTALKKVDQDDADYKALRAQHDEAIIKLEQAEAKETMSFEQREALRTEVQELKMQVENAANLSQMSNDERVTTLDKLVKIEQKKVADLRDEIQKLKDAAATTTDVTNARTMSPDDKDKLRLRGTNFLNNAEANLWPDTNADKPAILTELRDYVKNGLTFACGSTLLVGNYMYKLLDKYDQEPSTWDEATGSMAYRDFCIGMHDFVVLFGTGTARTGSWFRQSWVGVTNAMKNAVRGVGIKASFLAGWFSSRGQAAWKKTAPVLKSWNPMALFYQEYWVWSSFATFRYEAAVKSTTYWGKFYNYLSIPFTTVSSLAVGIVLSPFDLLCWLVGVEGPSKRLGDKWAKKPIVVVTPP